MANTYPLPKFHFVVQWGGTRIGFSEVTGLDMQAEAIEYREGSSPQYSKIKMPGMQKFSNITLKRGTFAGDLEFYTWIKTISLNTVERRDLTISLLNENHDPVINWKVINAFPVKVQASDLKADGNEVAIETLELAHEGLDLIT
ncbi:phage tail protein [Mucilaginibacter jinjuensis]|uniref:Phage tail protein n=1 Tax=Mucilaginibacter jinjuensis TaxID=1176721 RepID=A0ABY7T1U3_9SPHI|nr:phage tail protein [Mucilaginibacter jinjuensis]WCT10382.1 phage tail protein [Mucilaginibacter jinjuensis]